MPTPPTVEERAPLAGYAPASVPPTPPPTDDATPALPTSADVVERPIPAQVSAAWELELLIAGAVTFALFQLPASLEGALAWVEARTSGSQLALASAGYMYAKAIVYVLIVAFLLNLCARAYWVGLVGLHSVFPHGVRWDRFGSGAGPYSRAEYRRRLTSLPAVIGRVDNFASVIFSFAFLIVLTFVVSVAALALLAALAVSISRFAFGGRYGGPILATLGLLLLLPLVVAGIVDKFYGAKLDPAGRAAGTLRRTLRYGAYVNGAAIFGPIFLTLFTNLSKRVMIPLFYGAVSIALLLGVADTIARTRGLSMGGSVYLPDDRDVRGVANEHYESLRDAGTTTTVPMIQADVITGPYVRLFVPFRADRHDPWLAANCPGAAPLRETSLHIPDAPRNAARADSIAARTLACLARLHAVSLDGRLVPDLSFRFYTHPTTGRDGLVAYIPTAPLSPGMHVLGITSAPRPPGVRGRGPRVTPFEIPFWR